MERLRGSLRKTRAFPSYTQAERWNPSPGAGDSAKFRVARDDANRSVSEASRTGAAGLTGNCDLGGIVFTQQCERRALLLLSRTCQSTHHSKPSRYNRSPAGSKRADTVRVWLKARVQVGACGQEAPIHADSTQPGSGTAVNVTSVSRSN